MYGVGVMPQTKHILLSVEKKWAAQYCQLVAQDALYLLRSKIFNAN